jgi:hydroxymethylglutaryl-CoA reductase (NADPH)
LNPLSECPNPQSKELPPRIRGTADHTREGVNGRRALLREQGICLDQLAGEGEEVAPEELAGNIENLVGFARVPVGVIGPLRITGACAQGDYYVPLATTEGALVASYHRGALVVSRSGGVAVSCLAESVRRTPWLLFDRLAEAEAFLNWLNVHREALEQVVARTSRHCRLIDVQAQLLGRELFLILEFTTGDASGQNMVTIATEAVCQAIVNLSPVRPASWLLESNLSGDKKASALSFQSVRGKKVVAEAVIERRLVRQFLHTDPEAMVRYWQIAVLGSVQGGANGAQGQVANALAALFLACGQDVACVAEAAVGVLRLDMSEGDLYVSLSLPNLIVGTVGGGTRLPTARECLEMLGCWGNGKARQFAAICAATALAGEVSIIGSLCAGDFARAHATYGRNGKAEGSRNNA